MYSVPEALRNALETQSHTIRVSGEGGNFITSEEAVLLVGYQTEFLVHGPAVAGGDIISCVYTASCCGGDDIGIGCVCAASVQIVAAGVFDLLSEIITVEIGRDDQLIPLGTFAVTECKKGEDITTITAYDAAYYATGGDYIPTVESGATVQAVLNDIAQQCGLTVGTLPDSAATTLVEGTLTGRTCRDMLGLVAALVGRNVVVGRDGKLDLIWFASSGVSIDPDIYYSDGLSQDGTHHLAAISVTRTVTETITNADGTTEEPEKTVTLTAGEGSGTGISLENPFFTQEILDTVWADIGGMDYSVGSCSHFGGILTEPGDLVSVTDKQGNTSILPVMSIRLDLDGGCKAEISAAGQSAADVAANFTGNLNGKIKRIEADVAEFRSLTVQDESGKTLVNGGRVDTDTLFSRDIGITGRFTATGKLTSTEDEKPPSTQTEDSPDEEDGGDGTGGGEENDETLRYTIISAEMEKTDAVAIGVGVTDQSDLDGGTAYIRHDGRAKFASINCDGLRIPQIQRGKAVITPEEAGVPASVKVQFPKAFQGTPVVMVTPVTAGPGITVTGVGVKDRSKTGCTIWLTRSNTTQTSVLWLAVY